MTTYAPHDFSSHPLLLSSEAVDDLIGLMVAGQGTVTAAQLLAAGFTPDALVADGTLGAAPHGFQFCEPLTYVPHLVYAQWQLPGVIIGGLTAAIFQGVSVAMPGPIEVAVPPTWHAPFPSAWLMCPLMIPAPLRDYGVIMVRPMADAVLEIPMYAAAVAVAQVIADPQHSRAVQCDCVARYWSHAGSIDAPLREAAAAYGILPQLQDLSDLARAG